MGDDALDKVVLPLLDAFVAVSISQIEHDDAAVSPSVKAIAQTLEPFLASCIPDLERYSFTR